MSDIGITLPFPIVLLLAGALYWPVTLIGVVSLVALGAVLHRWGRIICFTMAAILAADCLLAAFLRG